MRVVVAERRRQLIEAAIRLMWRHGVEHTTLRDIAKEANAPLASVHYSFENKDALIQAAVEHWLIELVGTMVEDVPIEGGLRAALTRISDDFWASLEANPPNILAQLEVALWAIRSSGDHELGVAIYPRYAEVVGQVFARALGSANETSAIEPDVLARALIAIIDSCSLQFLADPHSPVAKQLYDMFIDALLDRAQIQPAVAADSQPTEVEQLT